MDYKVFEKYVKPEMVVVKVESEKFLTVSDDDEDEITPGEGEVTLG